MISAIIPFHNDWENIPITLGSCLMQDVPLEIMVVNDCSTPPMGKSARLIDMIADRYIINKENLGLAETRDEGIKACKYDYIIPLDCGDWLYPNVLGRMAQLIDGVDVVYGNMTEKDDGPVCVPPGRDGITIGGMMKMNQLWCSSLLRKDLWAKVGGYKTGLKTSYEDYTFWNKCLMAGAKFRYINATVYRHQYNPNSMLSTLHERTEYFNNLARRPLYEDHNMGA
jgi:glycosyltransferase involved in cell wall biosynthesis